MGKGVYSVVLKALFVIALLCNSECINVVRVLEQNQAVTSFPLGHELSESVIRLLSQDSSVTSADEKIVLANRLLSIITGKGIDDYLPRVVDSSTIDPTTLNSTGIVSPDGKVVVIPAAFLRAWKSLQNTNTTTTNNNKNNNNNNNTSSEESTKRQQSSNEVHLEDIMEGQQDLLAVAADGVGGVDYALIGMLVLLFGGLMFLIVKNRKGDLTTRNIVLTAVVIIAGVLFLSSLWFLEYPNYKTELHELQTEGMAEHFKGASSVIMQRSEKMRAVAKSQWHTFMFVLFMILILCFASLAMRHLTYEYSGFVRDVLLLSSGHSSPKQIREYFSLPQQDSESKDNNYLGDMKAYEQAAVVQILKNRFSELGIVAKNGDASYQQFVAFAKAQDKAGAIACLETEFASLSKHHAASKAGPGGEAPLTLYGKQISARQFDFAYWIAGFSREKGIGFTAFLTELALPPDNNDVDKPLSSTAKTMMAVFGAMTLIFAVGAVYYASAYHKMQQEAGMDSMQPFNDPEWWLEDLMFCLTLVGPKMLAEFKLVPGAIFLGTVMSLLMHMLFEVTGMMRFGFPRLVADNYICPLTLVSPTPNPTSDEDKAFDPAFAIGTVDLSACGINRDIASENNTILAMWGMVFVTLVIIAIFAVGPATAYLHAAEHEKNHAAHHHPPTSKQIAPSTKVSPKNKDQQDALVPNDLTPEKERISKLVPQQQLTQLSDQDMHDKYSHTKWESVFEGIMEGLFALVGSELIALRRDHSFMSFTAAAAVTLKFISHFVIWNHFGVFHVIEEIVQHATKSVTRLFDERVMSLLWQILGYDKFDANVVHFMPHKHAAADADRG